MGKELKHKEKEEALLKLRKSRKAYLVEYGCGALMLGSLLVAGAQGITLPSLFQYVAGSLGIISIGSAEWRRIITRYSLTPSKLIITHGIIKKKQKNVYWHPLGFVPDLNTHQGHVQRILNYGTIFVSEGTGEGPISIKDISSPHKVMSVIEQLIDDSRHKPT